MLIPQKNRKWRLVYPFLSKKMSTFSKQELIATLNDFVIVQQEHAELLQNNRMKSLPLWHNKRQQVFNHLKQCLDSFDPHTEAADSDTVRLVKKQLDEILAGEKKLAASVKNRQNKIKETLRKMRKGKKVLQRYGGNRLAAVQPTYISNNM